MDRDEFAERWAEAVRSFTEAFRPIVIAFTAQFNAAAAVLRPLIEYIAAHPELADCEPEAELESCHHLCGRYCEHECTGEATTTVAFRVGGREVPMCEGCRNVVARTAEPLLVANAERATCAHVCGPDPDHECEARATTTLSYETPGGKRTMPICQTCFNAEWAAKQRYELVSEGETVRLDCKQCPETLLRVAHPTEAAHDAVRDACAEHDRQRHAEEPSP
jgi:hypothetical protein